VSQFMRRKGLLNAIAGPWPFWTKTHLITHLKGKHKIFLQDLFITMRRKRPFECHLCHERFGQKAHLITHLKGKHKMWTSSWEEIALLNAHCSGTPIFFPVPVLTNFRPPRIQLLRFQFFSWKHNGLGINPAISRTFYYIIK